MAIAELADAKIELQTRVGELEASLGANPGNAALRAERDAAIAQLVNLNTRIQQIDINMALYGSGVEHFETADIPGSPVSPRPRRNATAAAVLGLLVAGAYALWRTERSPLAEHRHDPAPVLGAPLLGQVPEFASVGVKGPAPAIHDPDSRTATANDANLAAGAHVLGLLADAGLPTLLLKGGALIQSVYPYPGTRPMHDLDILVRFGDVRTAIGTLAAAGYEPTGEVSNARLEATHGAQFLNPDGYDVDLHWHALGSYLSVDLDKHFWDGAFPTDVHGSPTHMLNPAEQLCHVVAHGLRATNPPLRRLADVAMIMRSAGTGMDWDRLGWMSARLEITLHLLDTLHYLESQIGTPVPGEAFHVLRRNVPSPSERRRYRILTRLHPDSISAALMRGWGTYAFSRKAVGRRANPLGFPRFMWRYARYGSETVIAAIRRKLGSG